MAAPVGPKKVHLYTLEFKIQAVKLANHPEIQTQSSNAWHMPSKVSTKSDEDHSRCWRTARRLALR